MGFLKTAEKKMKEQKIKAKREKIKNKIVDILSWFKMHRWIKTHKKDKEKGDVGKKEPKDHSLVKEKKEDKGIESTTKKKLSIKLILNIVFTFVALLAVAVVVLREKKLLIFNKWVWVTIGMMLLTLILFVLNFSLQERRKEQQKTTVVKHVSAQSKESEKTGIDILYDFIRLNKRVSIDLAVKEFKVNRAIIEEWAKILESNDLIIIHYPAFGDAQMVLKDGQN